jgi:hypothetical protein
MLLENQTATAEPDLMALAMEADANPQDTPSTEPKETVPTDEQVSSEPKADEAVDPEKKPETKPEEQPKDQTESRFKKAQKEQARQAETWKKIEAEKAQLRAEREAIAREREEHRKQQEHKQRNADDPTADDYDRLAESYEAKGNDRLAQVARQKALDLRKAQTSQASAKAAQPDWQTPEFQTKWHENVQALIKEDPSLADDSNPVVGITNNLINEPNYGRFFRAAPDGIRAANEVAKIIHAAHTLTTTNKGLQQELEKSKAEIQRLTKLTKVSGSHPAAGNPAAANKKGDVSDDELMRLAADADAHG